MASHNHSDSWLVLGACGFIGRAVVDALKARQASVVGADREQGASPALDILQVDVTDPGSLSRVLRQVNPAVVVNAVGHPHTAVEQELFRAYVDGAERLLRAVQSETPLARVILLGSAAEYGNSPAKSRSRETDKPCPMSPYGRAKCGQNETGIRFRASGLDVISARLFNVIGPGQSTRFMVGGLIARLRKGETPLRVRDANYVRDWIDVRDVADALVAVGMSQSPYAVVNVCNGSGRSVGSVARNLAELTHAEVIEEKSPITPVHLWRSEGDPSRMMALGWMPHRSVEQSLREQWEAAACGGRP